MFNRSTFTHKWFYFNHCTPICFVSFLSTIKYKYKCNPICNNWKNKVEWMFLTYIYILHNKNKYWIIISRNNNFCNCTAHNLVLLMPCLNCRFHYLGGKIFQMLNSVFLRLPRVYKSASAFLFKIWINIYIQDIFLIPIMLSV